MTENDNLCIKPVLYCTKQLTETEMLVEAQ